MPIISWTTLVHEPKIGDVVEDVAAAEELLIKEIKEADTYGCYLMVDGTEAEILNLSNAGDYLLDDYENLDFEVVETEE